MAAGDIERVVTLPDGRALAIREGGDLAGAAVVYHHGTPASRYQAGFIEAAARCHGIRVVSFNRPGYGSAPETPPSLASVGTDAVHIADALDLEQFSTVGVSGGGPYALATALAGPGRVSQVAVVAGIGPWRLIEPEDPSDPERELLALADAGKIDAALAGYRAVLTAEIGDLLAIGDDSALVEAYLDGAPPDDLQWLDQEKRLLWAVDLREAVRTGDGYARDNVAWGGRWDIDIAAIRCPVRLYYGNLDRLVSPSHGRWLADRIPGAIQVTWPDAGHGIASFGHWDTIFASMRDESV
ncbi:pimeloyl-ACP methyl ester carboxylesterase [Krasilnikovia cinnamomea]|uniref:Pimeloyl-ACP methyl ester carboxylesterase n=1 Tax=Krasilnikovia cinnamomea TaxID=349313 RepID=A0A4Q7ZF70_9ACTN|nr:alpha/beta hydrolase [Krasilnikovia cinnamomea]RZU49348.1 pimeloyl-ACP methyl ester carboxylesterase [Krasilnikovia cinnamomea]